MAKKPAITTQTEFVGAECPHAISRAAHDAFTASGIAVGANRSAAQDRVKTPLDHVYNMCALRISPCVALTQQIQQRLSSDRYVIDQITISILCEMPVRVTCGC